MKRASTVVVVPAYGKQHIESEKRERERKRKRKR
jgi:hypothetical protein